MKEDLSHYSLPINQPVLKLNCGRAFDSLTSKEKKYAHYFSQASWFGGLIVFIQTSPESPVLFVILHKIFLAESLADLKNKALAAEVSEDDFTAFLVYTCGVFANSGNYKGSGNSKIIPNLPEEKFELIIKESKAYKEDSNFSILWNEVKDAVYSLDDRVKNLGLGDQGITTYFSANCTEDDAKLVNEFMVNNNLLSYNCRCFKTIQMDRKKYEIRLASTETGEDPKITPPEEVFKNALFKITRGDYNLLLQPVVKNLKEAKEYAANETQVSMISKYIQHFETGLLEDHKDASRFWIRDKNPTVETGIGFITLYRDPVGQRGEFMGAVAIVNPDMSKKFSKLVEIAETVLPKLPWGKDFEKDVFLKPEYYSLDVLTWSGAFAVPLGIAGPNYEEVQLEGVKNLSFHNAAFEFDAVPFVSEQDQELFSRYQLQCLELQTGLHESYGHSSGKLFKKLDNGSYNFDEVKNPFTGEPVTKYYEKGENYASVFGSVGLAIEECRAEGVGLYLSMDEEILKIFGHEGSEADDVIYVNWLSLLWKGCAKALESYHPLSKKWLQAHNQARYVLLRVCIDAGEEFVKVVETEPGKNLRLSLDRTKIGTVGKRAVGDFIRKLQYYRSTADVKAAQELFEKYSEVPETGPYPWTRWRDIVFAHKQPKKIFVQCNTAIDESGNVILKNYEATHEGLIQSWVDRFPDSSIHDSLVGLWEQDRQHFEPFSLKN